MKPNKSTASRIHIRTIINVLVMVVIFTCLTFSSHVVKQGHDRAIHLYQQQNKLLVLDDIASKTVLLLDKMIHTRDGSELNIVSTRKESLRSAFSVFQDAAVQHGHPAEITFVPEAESTIHAILLDIQHCESLVRVEQYEAAEEYFENVLVLRPAPIDNFVEDSRAAKALQISTETRLTESRDRQLYWIAATICLALVCIVAILDTKRLLSLMRVWSSNRSAVLV